MDRAGPGGRTGEVEDIWEVCVGDVGRVLVERVIGLVDFEANGSPVRWRIVLVPLGDGPSGKIQVRRLSNLRVPSRKLPVCTICPPLWTRPGEWT